MKLIDADELIHRVQVACKDLQYETASVGYRWLIQTIADMAVSPDMEIVEDQKRMIDRLDQMFQVDRSDIQMLEKCIVNMCMERFGVR
jgi:hypothetical protein